MNPRRRNPAGGNGNNGTPAGPQGPISGNNGNGSALNGDRAGTRGSTPSGSGDRAGGGTSAIAASAGSAQGVHDPPTVSERTRSTPAGNSQTVRTFNPADANKNGVVSSQEALDYIAEQEKTAGADVPTNFDRNRNGVNDNVDIQRNLGGDFDGDGIKNYEDTHPFTKGSRESDLSGWGGWDDDGDGINNRTDRNPTVKGSRDSDLKGWNMLDDDGDGQLNGVDQTPHRKNPPSPGANGNTGGAGGGNLELDENGSLPVPDDDPPKGPAKDPSVPPPRYVDKVNDDGELVTDPKLTGSTVWEPTNGGWGAAGTYAKPAPEPYKGGDTTWTFRDSQGRMNTITYNNETGKYVQQVAGGTPFSVSADAATAVIAKNSNDVDFQVNDLEKTAATNAKKLLDTDGDGIENQYDRNPTIAGTSTSDLDMNTNGVADSLETAGSSSGSSPTPTPTPTPQTQGATQPVSTTAFIAKPVESLGLGLDLADRPVGRILE